MSEMLNGEVGSVAYDNLVIEAGAVGTVALAAGQGVLFGGSVIDAEGRLFDGTAPKEGEAAVPRFILADKADTGETEGAAVTGTVYKTGAFIRNSLIVADGYEFTDADAESLRDYGIIVEFAHGAA